MPQTTAPFPGNSVTLCPLVVMLLTMSWDLKKKANSEYRIQSFLSSNEIIYRWETLFVLKFHREQLVVHPRTVNGLFDRFAEPKISDNCL
jgi:hypothetical protein